MNCPVCESEAKQTDIPERAVYVCGTCASIFESEGGRTFMMQGARAFGDPEDVKAATSPTHVTTMRSFLDQAEKMSWQVNFEWNANLAAMRETAAKIESRITGALSKLTELGIGVNGIGPIVADLEDARAMVADNERKYGVREKAEQHAEG